MSNLRARTFLSALLIQLFIAATISQQAFSQEAQTTASAPQSVSATAQKAMGKDAVQEEACEEQSPAAVVIAAPQRAASSEQAVAAGPLIFRSPREQEGAASSALALASSANSSPSNSFNYSGLSGAQQTGAVAATYTPLTPEQKMRRAFRSAFLSPQAYLVTGATSALTEAGEDDLPHKETDDRVADGLSRFAIRFSRRATYNLLGNGVYAVLFRQDTRYERAAEGKGFGGRVAHAVSRVFVTRGDNGKLQPNYSRFAGQLSASALSNLWEQSTPGHDRIGTDATFRRFGNSFISGAVFNVLNEFLPDIKKVFGR